MPGLFSAHPEPVEGPPLSTSSPRTDFAAPSLPHNPSFPRNPVTHTSPSFPSFPHNPVIPAKAGISPGAMDSGFRRNDDTSPSFRYQQGNGHCRVSFPLTLSLSKGRPFLLRPAHHERTLQPSVIPHNPPFPPITITRHSRNPFPRRRESRRGPMDSGFLRNDDTSPSFRYQQGNGHCRVSFPLTLSLSKGRPFLLRPAHHERTLQLSVTPA